MSWETVHRVAKPIPEIGAEVGDCLVADPSHPTHPLILTRRLSRDALRYVDTPGTVQIDPPVNTRKPRLQQRPALRLVREG